jgi:hypothetical protein
MRRVSTNSIAQGEQVGVLWSWMLAQGIKIQFAHRTFRWINEARGNAAVHCVIIGFGLVNLDNKIIFEYDDRRGMAHPRASKNIAPHLADAPDVVIEKRGAPICMAPKTDYGTLTNDNGHLTLDENEMLYLLENEPKAKPFIREFMGGFEFINNQKRYCFWLRDASPALLNSMLSLQKRVNAVREFRKQSNRAETRALASTPALFGENRQPEGNYLFLPKVSSETRTVVPIGFVSGEVIASGSGLIVPIAMLFDHGVLSSTMHMSWM